MAGLAEDRDMYRKAVFGLTGTHAIYKTEAVQPVEIGAESLSPLT